MNLLSFLNVVLVNEQKRRAPEEGRRRRMENENDYSLDVELKDK